MIDIRQTQQRLRNQLYTLTVTIGEHSFLLSRQSR